jgi:predicted transport protein
MSDIKLFNMSDSHQVEELTSKPAKLERDLQLLVEQQMEVFLGVRFLASEYTTSNRGRIDSLGLDENRCPVIIEYKRNSNQNVINQGLFYLNWLLDHKADFQLLVMKQLGETGSEEIEWAGARLICIANDFNRYDEEAITLIDRNIELMRYKYFGEDLLLLELVNVQASQSSQSRRKKQTLAVPEIIKTPATKSVKSKGRTHDDALEAASEALTALYHASCECCETLGDEVQRKDLKLYTAFKKIKNFASVVVYTQKDCLQLYLKVNPSTIALEDGFTHDVTNKGHWGTGNLLDRWYHQSNLGD